MNLPTAIITGATSGFGKAMTERLAANGKHNLVITGRRTERLTRLAKDVCEEFQVKVWTLAFDIRSKDEVHNAISSLPPDFRNVRILVNNAGLAAGRDNVETALLSDWDEMIDTNIKGLSYMTKATLPLMMACNDGHIVNIGSIAGKESYPGGSMYCASKHAVDAFTKALRSELLPHGIKVSQICPGAADTEFSLVRFKGNKDLADAVYTGYEPLQASDIADLLMYIVNCPPHVCINDVVITPKAQANSFFIHKKA